MEILLAFCTVIGGVAALWFFWDKRKTSPQVPLDEIARKIDQIGVGLDSEKNVRAIKYLNEQGFGNRHYKEFLVWAFGNIEKAVIAAYAAKSFDDLCESNGITVNLKGDSEYKEFYTEASSNAQKFECFWNGSSYFNYEPKDTFGAYNREKEIGINGTALKDFQTLHELFLCYVNNDFKAHVVNRIMSPEGIVPCNY